MLLLKGGNMNEVQEWHRRQTAIRLWLKGLASQRILKIVGRSRAWLSKWIARYGPHGWQGLRSQSRKPHHSAQAYSSAVRRLIERAYRRVQKRPWGLRGLSAVRHELRITYRLRPLPSRSTIRRVLRAAGVFKAPRPKPSEALYPQPRPTASYTIQAMDWTERFLGGGAKVYAFHTIDLTTRACVQTIRPDKTAQSVRTHLKKVWKTQGIPHGLQMDNDAAFYGSRRVPHHFGQIVRLCLYVGLEPIFIPVGEAKRNGDVEQLHGVWDKAVWQQVSFETVQAAQDFTPQFERWYRNEYEPPKLKGQTPGAFEAGRRRYRLTEALWQTLPNPLPLVAGRIHFLRRVSEAGAIEVLNEPWPGFKRLTGEYVWATLWTHRHLLEVYHRGSAERPLKRIKIFRYEIDEPIRPLAPEFQHAAQRRRMFTMS
jgi:putative transposase